MDSDHEELDGNKSRPSGEVSYYDYDHEIDSRRPRVWHPLEYLPVSVLGVQAEKV